MRQRHRGRAPKHQAGLFEPVSDRPRWSDLPQDTQRRVTDLVARMLRDQRAQEAAHVVREVEHE